MNTWLSREIPTWRIRSRKLSELSPPPSDPYYLYLGHNSPDFPVRAGLFSVQALNASYSFTFVRNPFGRITSLYKHLQRNDGLEANFIEFLEAIKGQSTTIAPGLAKRIRAMGQPMVAWFDSPRGFHPTKVFRYEELPLAVAQIKVDLGVDGEPEPIGVAPISQSSGFIGDAEASIIQEIYREDFSQFEYPLDTPEALSAY